jgi:hypothetical protein
MYSFGLEKRDYEQNNPAYRDLHESLATEFGVFSVPNALHGHANAIVEFFCEDATTEQALDMIDVSFKDIITWHRNQQWASLYRAQMRPHEAIQDLNQRFMEHGVGYAFVTGQLPQLIKKDNEHLHSEVVLPALRLLHEEGFSGANEEYRSAHEHYRHGAYKECLNDCLKAFESTMKTICTRKNWVFKDTNTASSLIEVCLKNSLLPTFIQSHLGAVRSALESAIPTVRNKLGGHGQGPEPKTVPQFYAEYLLHETAATIVFLVDAYKALK